MTRQSWSRFAVLGVAVFISVALLGTAMGVSPGTSFFTTVVTGTGGPYFSEAGLSHEGGDFVRGMVRIPADRRTLHIQVDNAYPGWEGTIRYRVENTGRLPVVLNTEVQAPPALDVFPTPPSGAIAPGGSDEGTVLLRVNETARENEGYELEVRLAITYQGEPFTGHAHEERAPLVAGYVAGEITPLGGEIAVEDGEFTIVIPPGAVSEAVLVGVSPVLGGQVPPVDGPRRLCSRVFQVTVETLAGEPVSRFLKDVCVRFALPPDRVAGVGTDNVFTVVWEDQSGTWLLLPTSRYQTAHLLGRWDAPGAFAVLYDPTFGGFTDMQGHWAEREVLCLASMEVAGQRVVTGYGDGTFRPDLTVTRQEFVKMVLLGLRLMPDSATAEDVLARYADGYNVPAWARCWMAWAVHLGVVAGYDGATLRSESPVSRAEAAAILGRALQIARGQRPATGPEPGAGTVSEGLLAAFRDATEVPDWAAAWLRLLSGEGVMRGYDDQTLRPSAPVTRGEAAVLVWRTLRLLK